MLGLKQLFVHSKSAIQSAIIQVMKMLSIAQKLQEKDLMLKRYFRLRFPEGQERLRFVYSYNSPEEISEVLVLLASFSFNRLVFVFLFKKKLP
jgi:8-amino-7-oxononanoate synthase